MALFDDPSDVRTVIESMRQIDITARATNRARILSLFNGEAPIPEDEAEANHIETNINDLTAPRVAQQARSVWNNAFLSGNNFCRITVDRGPVHKRSGYGSKITKNLNRMMKDSLAYYECRRATFAQVVLFGPGPCAWESGYKWVPDAINEEDFLVPSSTLLDFSNLTRFAIFRKYSPGKLYRMTHGPKASKGWKMELVNKQLERVAKEVLAVTPSSATEYQNQVKLTELYKRNGGYLESDSCPTINVWDFFYQDEKEGEWQRCMVLDDYGDQGGDFLYQSPKAVSKKISHLLHCQFADGSNEAPFYYHSVRSLGWYMYGPCHLQNRLFNRTVDSIFESLLMYFRNVNAEDRARLQKVDLYHMGLIPEGLSIVPAGERHSVNEAFVMAGLSQLRQKISENSAQYVQDVDNGTAKERTAFETMALINQANALVGAMITMGYKYENVLHREIARRACIRPTRDLEVQLFQKRCKDDGVPEDMLDSEHWIVQSDRTVGDGNNTLAMSQAQLLMAARSAFDPEPQREILHIYAEAVTQQPELADKLVPTQKTHVSDATHDAQLAVGTLLAGAPVEIKSGMNHIEYAEALLMALGAKLQQAQALGGMVTAQELFGLANLLNTIQQHVAIIAQDESQKQRVKVYEDAISQAQNVLKGLAQRLQEQQQAQGQNGDGKVQTELMTAAVKAQIADQNAALKRQHKDQAFVADQKRRDLAAQVDAARSLKEAEVAAAVTDIKTEAEVRSKSRKSGPAEE